MNNLPKVVAQQRRGRASNPRLLDRKSDALPLSHRARARYWSKIVIFSYPLAFDTLVRGVPVQIAPLLYWYGKIRMAWRLKNFEDIFIRFGATHERDGHTDRHRVTAIAALCIASHGNK